MDVSIIIPVYNVEKYIEQCLETVINQKTKYSYEIICINDGSSDGTSKILEKYKDNLKIINAINNGPGAARNLGIKNSIGKYLMFVDGDDYVAENFVEKMINTLEKEEADVAICNFCRFTDKKY